MKKYFILDDNKPFQPSTDKERREDETYQYKKYYSEIDRFYQIEKNSLITEYEIPFSLYIHRNLGFELLLKSSPSLPAKIPSDLFKTEGDIMIKISDIPLYNEYLESLEKNPSSGRNIKELKTIAIKEKSKILMKNILQDPRSGENIKESSKLVEKIATSIFNDKETLYDLISIKNYDYYTYTHSVNVAVLSIGMGITIGLPEDQVAKLGIGSMLHDIGKSLISPEILNKPSKLTAWEYQIMKNHVIDGERILLEHKYFPKDSFSAVIQHHEKLSGKGYPLGLQASKINLYGKIIAIADCYDALTTQRPYKPALTPFKALSIIIKEIEDYDNELLKIFIKMLGKIESGC